MRQNLIETIYQNYFLISNSQPYKDAFDISHAEFWLMEYLTVYQQQPEKMTVSCIAETFNVTNPAISRLVKSMICKDWLDRQENPEDRRIIHLQLTPKGQAVYQTQKDQLRQRMSLIYSEISDDDIAKLAEITSKVLTTVENLKTEQTLGKDLATEPSSSETTLSQTSHTANKGGTPT